MSKRGDYLRTHLSGTRRHEILDNFFANSVPVCELCGIVVRRLPYEKPPPGDQAVIDHIVPYSMIGISHDWNLRVICNKCNSERDTASLSLIYHLLLDQLALVRGTKYGKYVYHQAMSILNVVVFNELYGIRS